MQHDNLLQGVGISAVQKVVVDVFRASESMFPNKAFLAYLGGPSSIHQLVDDVCPRVHWTKQDVGLSGLVLDVVAIYIVINFVVAARHVSLLKLASHNQRPYDSCRDGE